MSLHDLQRLERALQEAEPLLVQGRVLRISGLIVEATLPTVPVGTGCEIAAAGGRRVLAEVVGFNGSTALLVPFGDLHGISSGAAVAPRASALEIAVGEELLGRVVDPSSRPVDGGPLPLLRARAALNAAPPAAMSRRRISRPVSLGVKCIDALLCMGEGQRMGILAGPGVGKSVLLGMVARHADADVIVVGLIGERGREVREFVERDLGPGLARSVVVVATADEPPLVRIRAALAATAVAEHFRARGKRVLLLLDSLTRVAMAQREIGLAAGEPPASKGYPPSVFAMLPRVLERAGNDAGPGSITGLYTVLASGDDLTDPVVDCAKAALDGHIVLSRRLAGSGHFPAIDVLQSISRVMTDVAPAPQVELAVTARELLASYDEAKDLIEVGAYVAGSNPRTDRAIACAPALRAFLRQPSEQKVPLAQALELLRRAISPPPAQEKRS